MVNVLDYAGDIRDGVTDASPAIEAARAAAHDACEPLYLPAGVYRITQPLVVDSYRSPIVGDGPQCTILKPELAPGDYALTVGWDPGEQTGPMRRGPFDAVSGLTIDLPIGAGQANGIRVDAQGTGGNAHSLTFRDISLVGGEIQVDLQDYVYLLRFDRVFFNYPNLYGLQMDNPSTAGEHISFDSCVFAGGPGTGVYVNKSGAAFQFAHCSFDYIARAVWQRAGVLTFNQCHFETGSANGAPGREFLLLDRRGYISRPMMALTDCDVFTVPSTYDTFIRCLGDHGDNGLRVVNPHVGLNGPGQPQCPYLVRDDGPSKSNIVIAWPWYVRGDVPPPKLRKQDGTDVSLVAGGTFSQT